ncbi:MAG: DUF123 domain-containing protein [Desulfurococcales archaeon]|nr:DUF123 domain-containing protein [Desulfurococcales archaeon]
MHDAGGCRVDALPNRGYYVLVFSLSGRLHVTYAGRETVLEPGVYAYVGSALRGLRSRVSRHVNKTASRIRWHIDRVTTSSVYTPLAVAFCCSIERGLEECIAWGLWNRGFRGPRGFGSTDTRSPTHLFRLLEDPYDSIDVVVDVLSGCCDMGARVLYCRL